MLKPALMVLAVPSWQDGGQRLPQNLSRCMAKEPFGSGIP
jgi:hypothetical protein